MSTNTEHLTSANKATTDFILAAANTALGSAERITTLTLDTARSVLQDSVANTKNLMSAKDVKEAISIQAALAKPSIEKAVAYSTSIYEISTEAQQTLGKKIEDQFDNYQKTVAELLEKASKSAPAGSEVGFAALRSALNASKSALDNLNATTKQFADATQENIKTAANVASKVASKKTVN